MNLLAHAQLPVPLPVRIVGGKTAKQEWRGPLGDAMAIGWYKPHPDHNIVYVCVMDETGQQWEAESPFVRFRTNITWGRWKPQKGKPDSDYGDGCS